jgi:excisionase family DNA binding protein
VSIPSTGFSDHELHGLRPLTITVQTASALSGIGLTTIWRLIKEKRLQVVRVDRRTLVIFPSLEELLTPTE